MTNGTEPPKLVDAAAIVGAATALVTGIGALSLTGSLGRVQRNHGDWFTGSIGVVVLGAGFGLIAVLLITHPTRRKVLQGVAITFVLLGVGVGFGVAIDAANDVERPSLAITMDEEKLAVTGKATAADLSSNDRLVVFVDGLVPGPDGYQTVTRLYQSYAGPDSDGNAEAAIDVQIPPGRFVAVGVKAFTGRQASDCDKSAPGADGRFLRASGSGGGNADARPAATPATELAVEPGDRDPGCVIVVLPGRPYRPQVTASWKPTDTRPSAVKMTVKASDVGVGGTRDVLIAAQVVGRRASDSRPIALYRAFIEPRELGPTTRSVVVPTDPTVRTVCAEARYVAPGRRFPPARCPIGKNQPPPVAAVQLRIPEDAPTTGAHVDP